MVNVELSCGFNAEVDETVFVNDFELLENIATLVDEDKRNDVWLMSRTIAPITESLLGKKQAKALRDHLRDEDGKINVSAMFTAVTEIISGAPKK